MGASTRRLHGALTEGREAASSKPLTTASTPALRFRRARAVRPRRANAAVLVCRQPPEPAIASTGALPSSLLSLRRPLDRAGRRRRTSAWPRLRSPARSALRPFWRAKQTRLGARRELQVEREGRVSYRIDDRTFLAADQPSATAPEHVANAQPQTNKGRGN
jgi:hypothetical protein